MTLEIIEQGLLSRSDSRVVLRGIDGIWEPDLHTLRINLKNSLVEKNNRGVIQFPITVWCTLDNQDEGMPVFRILPESEEEQYDRVWKTDEINILIDVVFPDYVCADIVPELITSSIEYIESNGRLINGNLFDLLSDAEISKFADRESWYRYIRISSDKSLSSAQHIDKDGRIISQEYLYYKYSNLKVFFDGGVTKLFNLDPEAMYLRLSGFADREEYYVEGENEPVFIGRSVVHIKEVPGLEINPRSRDKSLFTSRFNYSTFTLYCGEIDGVSLISDSPKSINFVSYSGGEQHVSNNIAFGSCEPQNDIWEFLEASTDLNSYRDSNSNPVFFLSGPTTISFTIWNAFRSSVYYSLNNVSLQGDLASHFTLSLQSWDINNWGSGDNQKKGVLEVNLVSDGSDNLNGTLTLFDVEDETEIVSFTVKTLQPDSKNRIFILDSTGSDNNGEFRFVPESGENNWAGFDVIGVSGEAEKVEVKFLNVYDLTCPLTMYQSHSEVSISFAGGEKTNIAPADKAVYLADESEINISQYINQNIVLAYGKEYTILAPGGEIYIPDGDTYLTDIENSRDKHLRVSGELSEQPYKIGYFLSSQTQHISETNVYFVNIATQEADLLRLNYSGFRLQEDSKYLMGYFLAGFNLDSVKTTQETATLIPVYSMPNVHLSGGCVTRTAYDRCEGQVDAFVGVSEVDNLVQEFTTNTHLDARNLLLGTGKTWIDLTLPNGTYNVPGQSEPKKKIYEIKMPVSTNPAYIQIDGEKWAEITGGASSKFAEAGSTVRIPINVTNTASRFERVKVQIQIGDSESTKVEEEFKVYKAAKKIQIQPDDRIVSGDTLIFEEPVELYYPYGYWLSRAIGFPGTDNFRSFRYFVKRGPAFNSALYSPYEEIHTEVASITEISDSDIGVFDGNLVRGTTNTFSWEGTKNTNKFIRSEVISSRNEYSDPTYFSRYIPEYRKYDIVYKLTKRDDFFPQYPVSKLVIKENQNSSQQLFLFYMPGNPYKLAAASKRHYIQITPQARSDWNAYMADPENVTKPSLIPGTFELKSKYFYVDLGFSTEYDVNSPDGASAVELSHKSARYLYHTNGDVRGTDHGDVYSVNKAFPNFKVQVSNNSTADESAIMVNYQFDPSLWQGDETNSNYNFVAELFFRTTGDPWNSHRSEFPNDIQSIIGHTLSWYYSDTADWFNEEYGGLTVPGTQETYDPEPYLRLIDNTGHQETVWEQVAYMPMRCQIRASEDPRSEEADLMASCYGTFYPWEVLGGYSRNEITIVPYPSEPENRIADIDTITYNQDHTRSTINVLVKSNTFRVPVNPSSQIIEKYYLSRRCSLNTPSSGVISGGSAQYLNIDQQPSSGYLYYQSDNINPSVFCASQSIGQSALIQDVIGVSKNAGTATIYLEYLDTEDIQAYISDLEENNSSTNVSFYDYIANTDRERYDWRGRTAGENTEAVEKVFDIEIEGDVEISYDLDIENSDSTVGNVGKLVLHYPENSSEIDKTGVFRLVRADNKAVILEVTLTQPGNSIISGFSGIINSAGIGRLILSSDYIIAIDNIFGPDIVERVGAGGNGSWQYKVEFPENHTPDPTSRAITITAPQMPDSEYTLSLSQGYHGIHIWRENETGTYRTDCDASGKYVFGSMENKEELNSKYPFDFWYSEPYNPNGEFDLETQLSAPTTMFPNGFDIDKLKVKSVKYQIVSPNDIQYDVSDVFASVSADVVYAGTVQDPYPYIQTLGTVYENKKELNLALVVEMEIAVDYVTSISFRAGADMNREIQGLEAINKVQIWYKV